MIRLIEALNFRCLRYVSQPLGPFHVLVGPNASGKTTFLDVVAFLGRLVSDGLEPAIADRTQNFADLLWKGHGENFELAVEVAIPEARKERLKKEFNTIRYEVRIGMDKRAGQVGILQERALLKKWEQPRLKERTLFPVEPDPPSALMTRRAKAGQRTVLSKGPKGNDNFYSEVLEESGKGWYPSVQLGMRRSALGNLLEDESRFPVSTWLKTLLAQGVQSFVLNSLVIRKASPPGQVRGFKPDGSNLPWVIAGLQSKSPDRFREWLRHIQTALADFVDVKVIEREDDKHRYLKLCYAGGLEVPSWMASDGTLRLLALTLPAYLPDFTGVYLIEEPENGIHPGAMETVFQSLSSVYDAQMLLASHSPVILSLAQPDKVLCFKKTESGATDIVLGSEHPALRDWRGQPNLSILFASGVLG
ncbi:MAG: ATP-binding protein [Planctomycetes bacterium]|nr:ATP-binding protein [Planctomycetota bacterium]